MLRIVVHVQHGHFGLLHFAFIPGLTAICKQYLIITILLTQLLDEGGSMPGRFADCRE